MTRLQCFGCRYLLENTNSTNQINLLQTLGHLHCWSVFTVAHKSFLNKTIHSFLPNQRKQGFFSIMRTGHQKMYKNSKYWFPKYFHQVLCIIKYWLTFSHSKQVTGHGQEDCFTGWCKWFKDHVMSSCFFCTVLFTEKHYFSWAEIFQER